jgi:hypothetical protein
MVNGITISRVPLTYAALFAVNEFAINLTSERIDDAYLKVFIVAQAVVAEVLSKLLAVRDGLKVAFEVDSDLVSHRNAILHVEKELLHCLTSNRSKE